MIASGPALCDSAASYEKIRDKLAQDGYALAPQRIGLPRIACLCTIQPDTAFHRLARFRHYVLDVLSESHPQSHCGGGHSLRDSISRGVRTMLETLSARAPQAFGAARNLHLDDLLR